MSRNSYILLSILFLVFSGAIRFFFCSFFFLLFSRFSGAPRLLQTFSHSTNWAITAVENLWMICRVYRGNWWKSICDGWRLQNLSIRTNNWQSEALAESLRSWALKRLHKWNEDTFTWVTSVGTFRRNFSSLTPKVRKMWIRTYAFYFHFLLVRNALRTFNSGESCAQEHNIRSIWSRFVTAAHRRPNATIFIRRRKTRTVARWL